ncbi:MAG: hypothetical protein MI810_22850 [Flavobacteriales bacterium]|nr:hypothetical protein [Flavobacteriales bacterium]
MKTFKLTLFALLVGTALASCKKEGCTDSDATNYDEKAKTDDATCTYEGSAVFWYGEATATALDASGTSNLKYYVNAELIGSSAADVFWTGAPDCGQDGSITFNYDMGLQKTISFSYWITNNVGLELWSGDLVLEANTCKTIELVF